MASPQPEDGYTRIANELIEALVRFRIPGQELRVVLAIARKTYGYGKKQDTISYGQIAQMTDIPRPKVIKHVKSLVSKKVLGSTHQGTRKPLTLWINKDYETWLPSPLKGTSPHQGTIASPHQGTKTSPHQGTHKRKKENLQKKRATFDFPDWLDKDLWRDFREHRRKLRKPMTDRAEALLVERLAKYKEEGYNPTNLLKTAIERGWLTVYKPKDRNGTPIPPQAQMVHCPGCHQEPSLERVRAEGGKCPACGRRLEI